jgi:hypothetical protein
MVSVGDKMEIREGSLEITAVFASHYNSPQSTTFMSIFKVNFSEKNKMAKPGELSKNDTISETGKHLERKVFQMLYLNESSLLC